MRGPVSKRLPRVKGPKSPRLKKKGGTRGVNVGLFQVPSVISRGLVRCLENKWTSTSTEEPESGAKG